MLSVALRSLTGLPVGSTLLIFLPRTSLFMEPLALFPFTHTHSSHTYTPHSAEPLERAWVGGCSCHLPQPPPVRQPWLQSSGRVHWSLCLFIWSLQVGSYLQHVASSSLTRDRTGPSTLGAWSLSHGPPGESQTSLLFQDIT